MNCCRCNKEVPYRRRDFVCNECRGQIAEKFHHPECLLNTALQSAKCTCELASADSRRRLREAATKGWAELFRGMRECTLKVARDLGVPEEMIQEALQRAEKGRADAKEPE